MDYIKLFLLIHKVTNCSVMWFVVTIQTPDPHYCYQPTCNSYHQIIAKFGATVPGSLMTHTTLLQLCGCYGGWERLSTLSTKAFILIFLFRWLFLWNPFLSCSLFREFSLRPLNNLLRLTGLRRDFTSNPNAAFTGASVKVALKQFI